MASNYSREQIIEALRAWLDQTALVNKSVFQEGLEDLSLEDLKKLLVLVFRAAKTEEKMDVKQKEYLADQIRRFYGEKKIYYEQAHTDMVKYGESLSEKEESRFEDEILNADVW